MPGLQRKLITNIIVAVVLFALGKTVEQQFDHNYSHDADTYSIQQTIKDQQNDLIHAVNNLHDESLWKESRMWATMDSLVKDEIFYYVFKDSTLVAWSTHTVPIRQIEFDSPAVIKLDNGWYLRHQQKINNLTLMGISLIKEEYEYQNKFLRNQFADDYTLTHHPSLFFDLNNTEHAIYDINNNYLFSLAYSNHDVISPTGITAFCLFLLSFAILCFLPIRLLEVYKRKKSCNRVLGGTFFYFVLLYILFINLAIPAEFKYLSLFSPLTFAVSEWLPSLGSLLIGSLFLLTFAYCFYRHYKTPVFLKNESKKWVTYLLISVRIILVLLLFVTLSKLVELIVINSSQATIFFNIEDLNDILLYKVCILCICYTSIIFIYERMIVTIKDYINFGTLLLISISSFIIVCGICLVLDLPILLINLVVFLVIGSILFKAHRNRTDGITYSSFIWVIFVSSFYVVFLLYSYNIEKEESNRELLVENLSFQLTRESDLIAEMYLSEIENRITTDEKLIELVSDNQNNEQVINDYLKKNYFYGYWKRYDLEVVVCWENAPLYLESENITTDCYSYFDTLIANQGRNVASCKHFYFLDNDNGQISYFGKIPFHEGNPHMETTLYCDINSTPIFSGLGYPELLQSHEEQQNNAIYRNYSFAKYINKQLVKQLGFYRYPINNPLPEQVVGEKNTIIDDNMVHLIYQLNEQTTLVLSRPEIKRIYLLMSFSTFALLFFIITAILFFITRTQNKASSNFSIQERIQIAFVSLMVIILLVMGISSVFYSVHQFKAKNNQMLSQRIKSVLQEMEQKIVNESKLDDSMHDYLQYLMQKFSNVFYSDINLYNTDGQLLATSRPELYQQGLSGKMMNPQAFHKLTNQKKAEFIHDEYIGDLHFTSAYVPIYNYKHEVLAFLNLPYFVGNNELKSEISSLIVAVINAYLLFVLFAIGVAVIISRRITRPLFLIQDRLAQIRIDKMNQKIGYKGNDEIGSLVKEYNRMVDEISESAEKLAKSEREMAWREMAKQIAHEIKNPLTPMKLSVQYLMKAWDNKQEDFDVFLKRVSSTLIEQIDQLHIIANEFSDFAKMPQAKRSKVDIVKKILNTVNLFEKSEPNIRFSTDVDENKRFIFADPDQMLSVLNNIFKNAVQSIPNDRDGIIKTTLKVVDLNIIIMVSDNGRGMNEEVKNKIFMPNFTTKSSGMGLGLAIVQNIVKNSGGKIWFETIENVGSTFYIQLPIYDGN
ncbi:MAG: ATP-binding protein [Carboxylicivirga sp.]|jgi:nitrogen fixation/metabolism regulation signal transduction histidine kinase|nr:ATP-binding protein [Carboxylicivirga sp.]